MVRNAVILILYLAAFIPVVVTGGIGLAETDSETKMDAWESDGLNEIHAVREVIYAWIDAWQRKDLDSYMSYYSSEFRSGKLDDNDWRQKKARIFKRPGNVSIEISNLIVLIEGNEAKVDFRQEYKDAYIADVGKKNMRLVKLNGAWKIVAEHWQAVDHQP